MPEALALRTGKGQGRSPESILPEVGTYPVLEPNALLPESRDHRGARP